MTDLPPYGALNYGAGIGQAPPPQLGQQGVVPGQIRLPADAPAITRFEDALPGSKIAVFGPDFEYGEECTVLEMKPEYGPTSIPALIVVDSKNARRIISSVGRWTIQVLLSAKDLGIEQIPDGAIRARNKPTDVVALQWHGGAGEATTIIMWAAGKAAIQYVDEDQDGNERLVIQRLDTGSEEHARPGDFLVKEPDGDFHVVLQGEFPRLYERVSV
jgi:hypothetical protein